ncbi:MAG: TonB-dependent receptor [Pseudomonadota bacterium]
MKLEITITRCLVAAWFAFSWLPASATTALDDLSLEELTKTEISSVSRRSQSLANVPAAAFVISAEDIRRSGAYALPDVLRMVPGIEVAQVDNGRYAVSARGFNGRFANKLQVLVDGRSIYSPFFSGVMWEHDPVALDDIERIEVIRGPGAAMWGANAVNGVINIITKHSATQEGGLIAPNIGSNGFGQIYGRYGKQIDNDTSWRLSLRARHMDPSTRYAMGTESSDTLKNVQANFRFDRNLGGGSNLSVWAGAFDSKAGDLALLDPVFTLPPSLKPAQLMQTDDSQTLAARYRWLAGAVESSLQLSATRTHIEVEGWFDEDRETYDLDYQGRRAFDAHDVLWGLSHRTNSDTASSVADVLALSRKSFTQRSTGLFVHDDWTLIPERLQFGFGARWEHSNLGGATFAPSATLMWTPSRANALWAKLARAPRVPARGEYHVSALTTFIPSTNPFQPAVVIRNVPPQSLDPETMTSLELGYRAQVSPGLTLNVTAYRQRYEDRVSGQSAGLDFATFFPILILQDITIGNYSSGWINGAELSADWLVTPNWRLQLSLTTTRLDMDGAETPEAAADNAALEKRTPKHYGSLRSQWNISANQQLDAWLRGSAGFVMFNSPYTDTVRVPGYVTLDLRYAYRINKDLELSVTGRNLIGARRYEYVADYVPSLPIEIKPSLILGLHVGF